MILIADNVSTKCDWVVVDKKENVDLKDSVFKFYYGFNPLPRNIKICLINNHFYFFHQYLESFFSNQRVDMHG